MNGLELRSGSKPGRLHGVVVDRSGGKAWRTPGGDSVLHPGEWELTVIADRWSGGPTPRGVRVVEIGEFTNRGIRDAVAALVAAGRVDRISTGSEYFLTTVAAIREDLGIPGKTRAYAGRVRDKWLMKQRAQQISLPCAKGACASNLHGWSGSRRAPHGYVAKPRTESGSRGVTVVPDWDSVTHLVERLTDPAGFLVEEFDPSPVLHVDGFVVGSEVHLQVSRYLRPCYVTGGRVPLSSYTVDDAVLIRRVSEFMAKLIDGWPIHNDVFHCELFESPSRLSLCEVAARPGGAGVAEVFQATKGINLRHAKTLFDFGLDPLSVAGPAPTAPCGGWTVVYAPWTGPAWFDDTGLRGHETRQVLGPSQPRVADIAGVGIATYTFTAVRTEDVLGLIDQYERGVRVLPVAPDVGTRTAEGSITRPEYHEEEALA